MQNCNCNCPEINPETLDIFSLPLDCAATWDLIKQGRVKGCFQIESNLGVHWSKQILPDNLNDLAAIIALVRPGTLEVVHEGKNMPQHYADRKNGKEENKPLHPKLENILKETYQILIYQESALQIAKELANFDLKEADLLRIAIGKKIVEEMAKAKKLFIEKATNSGLLTKEDAEFIINIIEKSQRYSFNKCLSGDTILYRSKNRYSRVFTIEEMYRVSKDIEYAKSIGRLPSYKKYKLKKFGKCLSINNGRVKENKIVDIYYQGVKDVYKLTTECGRFIKCTLNHKFPTTKGEFQLSELKIGDELYYKGDVDLSHTKKYNWSNTSVEELRNLKKEKYNNLGFVKGENNPGYINGQFTLWKKNIELLPMICDICRKTNCKFEVHHKNGDRTNNSLENLQRLCISCHKKEEYKAGRTKRGEKGYLLKTTKIKSIEYIGKEVVYDVEMTSPYHTLTVDNGLITSNSHSYSYANYSYISAYIKTHFPLEFFCSWLTFAGDKPNPKLETKQLINDAKTFDINILNPYLPDFSSHCYIANKEKRVIRFGIVDIAGIGENTFNKIKKIKFQRPLKDLNWLEFLILYSDKIDQTSMKALVGAGALDYMSANGKISRQRMLYEYDKWLKLTDKEVDWIKTNLKTNISSDGSNSASIDSFNDLSYILRKLSPTKKEGGGTHSVNRQKVVNDLVKLLENPPHSLDDTVDWVIEEEERLLGIALSQSRLTAADIGISPDTTIDEFNKGKNAYTMIIAANIDSTRVVKVKKGKSAGADMAFLGISDDSGSMDAVAFSECWNEYSRLLAEGRSAMLAGNRDKNKGSFIINKVWSL